MAASKNKATEPKKPEQGGKGQFLTIIVVLLIIGAFAYAYTKGFIPGFGGQEKQVANELKQDIQNIQGNKIEGKVAQYLNSHFEEDEYSSPEQKQEAKKLVKELTDGVNLNFQYDKIEEVKMNGAGAVKIISPSLAIDAIQKGESGTIRFSSIEIGRALNDPNHYFYKDSGDFQFLENSAAGQQKVFGINYQSELGEIRLNDAGEVEYAKGGAKNLEIVEGRGNTVLLKIAETKSEHTIITDGDQIDAQMMVEYNNIEPGDMIKMMVGAIEPISIKMDFDYKGHNPNIALMNIENSSKGQLDKIQRALKGEKVDDIETSTDAKEFNADLKINNFSILMGDGGFIVNGGLSANDSAIPMPKGDVKVTFANYRKFLKYITKFFPMPQTEIDHGIAMMKSVGTEAGDDIIFDVKFDGTENVKIGGKTMEEIEELQKQLAPTGEKQEIAGEDKVSKTKPLGKTEFQQSPISTPEVKTKALPAE